MSSEWLASGIAGIEGPDDGLEGDNSVEGEEGVEGNDGVESGGIFPFVRKTTLPPSLGIWRKLAAGCIVEELRGKPDSKDPGINVGR